MNSIKTYLLFILVFAFGFSGCKKWDDHTKIGEPDLSQDLLQAVSGNASLSKFRQYISQAGLDSVLQSSKTYTVWAPTDAALQNLDPAIIASPELLRNFVMNHFSNQLWFTRNAQAGTRVHMLNGKYNLFTVNKFGDANITSSDKYVNNGVLHVIDKALLVLPSVWEYINSSAAQFTQNGFISSLNFNSFDPSLAIIDSISALTGLPVYHPGTGIVVKNRFNDRIYDLRKEDKQYTYFVMANQQFTKESDSLKIYYQTGNTVSTDSLAKWNVARDLVFEGLYLPGTLPNTLVSKSGGIIPLNGLSIVETKILSNGIVYVVSNLDVPTISKFPEIRREGENPSGFLSDKTGNTNYRIRQNPVTSQVFSDIMISGHGVTAYYAFYRFNEMPSMKFKVYAFGVNDFQTGVFTQNVVPKFLSGTTYTTLATLAHAVPLSTAAGAYNEVYLGEFTSTSYGTLEIQLTSTATNPLVLDYLRVVPVPF